MHDKTYYYPIIIIYSIKNFQNGCNEIPFNLQQVASVVIIGPLPARLDKEDSALLVMITARWLATKNEKEKNTIVMIVVVAKEVTFIFNFGNANAYQK